MFNFLKRRGKLKINYDEEYDIMYIKDDKSPPSYGVDSNVDYGITKFLSLTDDKLVGIEIVDVNMYEPKDLLEKIVDILNESK